MGVQVQSFVPRLKLPAYRLPYLQPCALDICGAEFRPSFMQIMSNNTKLSLVLSGN